MDLWGTLPESKEVTTRIAACEFESESCQEKYLPWVVARTFSYHGKYLPAGTMLAGTGFNAAEIIDGSFISKYDSSEGFFGIHLDELADRFPTTTDPNLLDFLVNEIRAQHKYIFDPLMDRPGYLLMADMKAAVPLLVHYDFMDIKGRGCRVDQEYVFLFSPLPERWKRRQGEELNHSATYVGSRDSLQQVYRQLTGEELPEKVPFPYFEFEERCDELHSVKK